MATLSAKTTVNEVAWSNGTATKYQAIATVTYGKDDEGNPKVLKRVLGDPMPTMKQARKALRDEVIRWEKAIHAIMTQQKWDEDEE